MSYELVESQDGTYAVHWPTIYKIIESRVRAAKQNQYARLVSESQTTWHPLSWGLPDLVTVEVDWDRVRSETRAATDAEYMAMRWNAHSSMADQVRKLRTMIAVTWAEKNRFRGRLERAQEKSMSAVDRAVGRADSGIAAMKLVRDASAGTLMIGATVLSGGTAGAAFATLATGSGLKATAKYQDTGNLGAASVELAGNLFFGMIPIGRAGEALKGAEKAAVLIMQANWSATVSLVEGKSLSESLASGALTLIADPVAGAIVGSPVVKKGLEKVAVPAATAVLRGASAADVEKFVSGGAEAIGQRALNWGAGAIAGRGGASSGAAGPGAAAESARTGSPLIDRAVIDANLLLSFAVIDMERGLSLP